MSIASDMREILLSQSITRSSLLAPLGSISETGWLIMLNLYSSDENDGQTLAGLSMSMNMPAPSLARYVAVLEEVGFVDGTIKASASAQGRYWLTPKTHQAVDDILHGMAQGVLPSLGKESGFTMTRSDPRSR